MGISLSFAALCIFICVGVYSIVATKHIISIQNIINKKDWIYLIVIFSAFLLTIWSILSKEQFVYYWDYGNYWYKTLDYTNMLISDPLNAINSLIYSINNDDYNFFLCLLIAAPLKILGQSYVAFVILNIILFYIPTVILIVFFISIICYKTGLIKIRFTFLVLLVILFNPLLFPVLQGYIDIAGMIPLISAYILAIGRNHSKLDPINDISIAICIILTVISRRYYAYAVVGFAIYWVFEGLNGVPGKSTKDKLFANCKCRLIDGTIITVCILLIFFTIFHDFFFKSVFSNYVVAYSAYKTADFVGEIRNLINWFGDFKIILFIVGMLFLFISKAYGILIGLLLGFFTTCFFFYRVQDMGAQHYYVVCVYLISGYSFAILKFLTYFAKKAIQNTIVAVFSFTVILGFTIGIGIIEPYNRFLSGNTIYSSRMRYDIQELNKLEDYLGELANAGYYNVYYTGSSGIINDDLMRKLNAPDMDLPYNCMYASHVDLRDGFNQNYFYADVLVVCDPTQTHLQSGQKLVALENDIMLEKNEFSDNYILTETFYLDGGVKALVFVKSESLQLKDINYFKAKLEQLYPEYPEMFSDRVDYFIMNNY